VQDSHPGVCRLRSVGCNIDIRREAQAPLRACGDQALSKAWRQHAQQPGRDDADHAVLLAEAPKHERCTRGQCRGRMRESSLGWMPVCLQLFSCVPKSHKALGHYTSSTKDKDMPSDCAHEDRRNVKKLQSRRRGMHSSSGTSSTCLAPQRHAD